MKRSSLLIALFISIALLFTFIFIPRFTENTIKSLLSSYNLQDVEIENVSYGLSSIKIESITSKTPHKIFIKNLQAHLSWLEFFTSKKINAISIEKYKTDQRFQSIFSLSKQISVPDINTITIEQFFWRFYVSELLLENQDYINLSGKIDIKKKSKNSEYKVRLNIQSEHENLAFSSNWDGELKENILSNLNGNFDQIKIKNKFLTINRGTGWVSLEHDKKNNLTISGQAESGNGKIFKFPCNNLNFITHLHSDKTQSFLFQTTASGYPNIKLAINSKTHPKQEKDNKASLSLISKNENHLAQYLANLLPEQNKRLNFLSEDFINSIPTSITVNYLPERKFAGGPFPFELTAQKTGKEVLSSTFLIYPKEMNLRGNIEANENTLQTITDIFNLSKENITGNNLKLDHSLSNLRK